MILRNFVVFEGLDGSGTTTQLKALEKRFSETGKPAFFTVEPSDSETGKLVRRILSGKLHVEQQTLARLFAADRGEHLFAENGIQTVLSSGKAVFCDRYVFSSLAYQGISCDPLLVAELNKPFPLPEYLFFFDIDPELSMQRVSSRGEEREIYEKISFQKKVYTRYLTLLDEYSRTEPEMTIIRIPAGDPIQQITEKIWSIVGDLPKL